MFKDVYLSRFFAWTTVFGVKLGSFFSILTPFAHGEKTPTPRAEADRVWKTKIPDSEFLNL